MVLYELRVSLTRYGSLKPDNIVLDLDVPQRHAGNQHYN